jgi:hypothetical protein
LFLSVAGGNAHDDQFLIIHIFSPPFLLPQLILERLAPYYKTPHTCPPKVKGEQKLVHRRPLMSKVGMQIASWAVILRKDDRTAQSTITDCAKY